MGRGQLAKLLRGVQRLSRRKERGEVDELEIRTWPIFAYFERQAEIEAAATTLGAYREEFARLMSDEPAHLERVRALFAEDRFVPLRFTAADIRRAFDHVGHPPSPAPDDRFVEKLRAAILYLADRDRRSQVAMNLLLHLPDYVAQGRYLDGWLIQDCAHTTLESDTESNPFLFEMFSFGYSAWSENQVARQGAVLREVGMDPERLRGMKMEEIEAWLDAQQADPDQRAHMEAVLRDNPDQQAAAVAGLLQMERDSIRLLEREDARDLLLTADEVEPWLPTLLQRFETTRDALPKLADGAAPDEAAREAFAEAIWPAFGELAQSLFTPERIRQLVAELRKYRDDRFAAGDKDVAAYAMGAIASLRQEVDPARNYFLNALCFLSVRTLGDATGDQSSATGDAPPASESGS